MIELRSTCRGFAIGNFADFNGEACSIQKSSLATGDCIWLGIDDAKPVVLIPGKSWQPVEFPEGTEFTTRMHLSREQVVQLLPLLTNFVATGELETVRTTVDLNDLPATK